MTQGQGVSIKSKLSLQTSILASLRNCSWEISIPQRYLLSYGPNFSFPPWFPLQLMNSSQYCCNWNFPILWIILFEVAHDLASASHSVNVKYLHYSLDLLISNIYAGFRLTLAKCWGCLTCSSYSFMLNGEIKFDFLITLGLSFSVSSWNGVVDSALNSSVCVWIFSLVSLDSSNAYILSVVILPRLFILFINFSYFAELASHFLNNKI